MQSLKGKQQKPTAAMLWVFVWRHMEESSVQQGRGVAFSLNLTHDIYMKQHAAKEIVAAGLFTDESGRILIVKPEHKDGWIFPGGLVEIMESPSDAFKREIAAEIGIGNLPEKPRLLSLDYHGVSDEYIMFMFDGGTLSREQAEAITLSPNLTESRFVTPEEALTLLRTNSARRLMPTLDARNKTGIAYLEHQEIL